MTCPGCGDRQFVPLGRLGTLLWFRCRLCGSTAHRPRATHPWLQRQLPSLSPQLRRAFGDYSSLSRNCPSRFATPSTGTSRASHGVQETPGRSHVCGDHPGGTGRC